MTDTIIRASSLSGYADCPRRAAARMFRGEIAQAGYELRREQPGIGAAIGSAVHAGAKLALAEKAETGIVAPLAQCRDVAIEEIRARSADGMNYDQVSPSANDAQQQALRMVQVYHVQVAPKIAPLIVEERLEATVAPGVVLSGQADVVAREPSAVDDLKTGKFLGNHNPQIGAYSLLARSHGIDITSARVDFIPRAAIKKPQPDAERYEHDIAKVENAASNVLRMVQNDLAVFRLGDPKRGVLPGDPWAFAANPASKLCGPKYCVAFGTKFCVEHAPERQSDD